MPRAPRLSVVVAATESLSDRGTVHEVRTDGEALWCTCMGWRFSARTRPVRGCRHTDAVAPAIAGWGGLKATYDVLALGVVASPPAREDDLVDRLVRLTVRADTSQLTAGLHEAIAEIRRLREAAPEAVAPAAPRQAGVRRIILRD